MQNLLRLCTTPKCDRERAYMGTFIGGAPVMMEAKHKWHNEAYIMHAAVKNYPPYALGGGYILSYDILKVRLPPPPPRSAHASALPWHAAARVRCASKRG